MVAGRHDAGCHRGDERVVEVSEERGEPSGARLAVGVDECDERAACRLHAGVAGTGGPQIDRQGHQSGSMARRDGGGGAGVGRRVIHDDAVESLEGAQQTVELLWPVSDRHDNGDVTRRHGRPGWLW